MHTFGKFRRRFRLLFDRPRIEQRMRDEMAFHIEEATKEHVRGGVQPEEARRRALIEFGGVEQFKEEARAARAGRWLEDLMQDLAYSRRQMARAPFATIAIVCILGVGVSGAGLAYSVVRAYLQRPLPVPDADRLAWVIPAASRNAFATIPDLRGVDWARAAQSFEATAAWDLDGFTIVGGMTPEYVNGAWVSPGYFDLLGARLLRGRHFLEQEYVAGNRVALISEQLWRQRFGGADFALGSLLRLHSTDRPGEEELVTIVGVLAPHPWRVNGFQEVLRPLSGPRMFSLARLRAGMSSGSSAERLTAAVREQVPVSDSTWRMSLVSALDEHVHSLRPMLRALFAMSLVLLLLSISSVSALIVARGDERNQEMVVRRALGASSARLTRQLTVETGVTWLLATVLGLIVTAALGQGVARRVELLGGVSVPAGASSVHLDASIIGFIVLASLLPFVLFGLAPLVHALLSTSPAAPTGSRVTASRGTTSARRALVAVQVALAVALPINASLLVQSVRRMATASLGFDSTNLLKAHLLLPRTGYPDSTARLRAMDGTLERVSAVPGVRSATVVHPHPFRGTVFSEIECEGCQSGQAVLRATAQTIAPNYFETLSIPIAAGRPFSASDDGAAPAVAIISASLARHLGGDQESLGRRVRLKAQSGEGAWLTVVGVTGDVRKTFGDTLYADFYVPFAQNPRAYFALFVKTAVDPHALSNAIRQAVAVHDPTLALSDVESMGEVLRSRRGPQEILASFAGAAAALALILSACALYSVVAYLASRRRREFALRIALGANGLSIARLVANEAARLLAIGATIGVAAAVAGSRILRSQLFGITALDLPTYAGTVVAVVGIAAVALARPAARAARQSPAEVLRADG